jgi:hypothetical protein
MAPRVVRRIVDAHIVGVAMVRMAFLAIALALLGACASLGPASHIGFSAAAHASFDEASAPVEAPVVRVADRRHFSPPSRRQPDLRPIGATAADRWRRHVRRRRITRGAV